MEAVRNLEELAAVARAKIGVLPPREDGATLVTLSGELGAGKTTFVQAAAKALGIEERVTSPTFVLEKIYQLPEGSSFARLVHIDAYRLNGGSELAPLGFSELMKDSKNLIMLEWPEKVGDALPTPALAISLSLNEDTSRTLAYA